MNSQTFIGHVGVSHRRPDERKTPQDNARLCSYQSAMTMEAVFLVTLTIDVINSPYFTGEPEEFQSIGLICRESLIDLAKELYKRNPEAIKDKDLKQSDFKGIANEFIDIYIPGEQNSDLRNYARKIIDIAWSYNSATVHSPNKTYPDVKIALLFTSTAVSLLENLFYKYLGFDSEINCSECGSKSLEFFEVENESLVAKCKKCGYEELFTKEE